MPDDIQRAAAKHGLEAHVLYQLTRDLRKVARDARFADEAALAILLSSEAKRIDARRRRVMARPANPRFAGFGLTSGPAQADATEPRS